MSGNSQRHRVVLKIEGLYRRLFMLLWARKSKSFLMTEYPKSGGSWLTTMLAEIAQVDFPRNRFPYERESAFQGHYIKAYGQKRVVVLWRDPRDIVVSYYFHSIVGNSHTNPAHVQSLRASIGISKPENVKEELPKFIDYMFSGNLSPRFTWNDFFDRWYGEKSAVHVSYEELHKDAASALTKISEYLSVDVTDELILEVVKKNSFENKTGRKPGEENNGSFARKGIVGDWKNYFTDESLSLFNSYVCGREKKLGYSHD